MSIKILNVDGLSDGARITFGDSAILPEDQSAGNLTAADFLF